MATVHLVARRSRTADRGPPHPEEESPSPGDGPPLASHPTILTVEQLGPKREMTPQGFMLCRDVPVARTGWMMYAPGETPIKPAMGGAPICYVNRGPEDLFAERTLSSIMGIAVTHEHPPVDVTAQNWSSLSKGVVLAVRRGEGDENDLVLADLLVTDKWLIEQINDGKREVSLGYDASYQQTGDGQGRQFNILANHIALVEKGRCGPRCAIGDRDSLQQEEPLMAKENTGGSRPRTKLVELRQRVTDLAADLDAAVDEEQDEGIHIHVHTGAEAEPTGAASAPEQRAATVDSATEARISGLEEGQKAVLASVEALTKLVTERIPTQDAQGAVQQPAGSTTATQEDHGDSSALERSYANLTAQAEILVPGFKVPTFDSKVERKATVDSMCALRRSVLTQAYASPEGKGLVDSITGNADLGVDKMDCTAVAVVFNAAATMKGAANNRAATGDRMGVPQASQQAQASASKKVPSLADINEANAKFWASRPVSA